MAVGGDASYDWISCHKSCQSGLCFWISLNFEARFHFLNYFSLVIAEVISECNSK
jgi:hypothetical protein